MLSITNFIGIMEFDFDEKIVARGPLNVIAK